MRWQAMIDDLLGAALLDVWDDRSDATPTYCFVRGASGEACWCNILKD